MKGLASVVLCLVAAGLQAQESVMQHRIQAVTEDMSTLERFYNIRSSATRVARFDTYYCQQLDELKKLDFGQLDHDSQIDYLLLKHHLMSAQRRLHIDSRLDNDSIKV